ncbi:MAG TPA: hypothetical protein VLM85_06755 [Polyangiaceae bacterium]|nr:hypothetical protein [Polyangiaceae bacterium]
MHARTVAGSAACAEDNEPERARHDQKEGPFPHDLRLAPAGRPSRSRLRTPRVPRHGGQVDFYVDQTKYETVTSASVPSSATWELDKPFFILLNLAVGSKDSWPGAPDTSTIFPAELLVDYVRVYTPQ